MTDRVVSVTRTVIKGVRHIKVLRLGRQGANGAAGADGLMAPYLHTQAIAAATWTINHNLGERPLVQVFDEAGEEIGGSITHPTVNQTVIEFQTNVSGTARLL